MLTPELKEPPPKCQRDKLSRTRSFHTCTPRITVILYIFAVYFYIFLFKLCNAVYLYFINFNNFNSTSYDNYFYFIILFLTDLVALTLFLLSSKSILKLKYFIKFCVQNLLKKHHIVNSENTDNR